MMVGNRYYSEADMMRMQRDAEERVREMRNRTRQTADANISGNGGSFIPAFANPNRNWNAGPNTQRNRNRANNGRNQQGTQQSQHQARQEDSRQERGPGSEPDQAAQHQPPPEANTPPEEKKSSTIVEDIIGSLGIETDTILIIGLILILINQKADTTLILALAYLLIPELSVQ